MDEVVDGLDRVADNRRMVDELIKSTLTDDGSVSVYRLNELLPEALGEGRAVALDELRLAVLLLRELVEPLPYHGNAAQAVGLLLGRRRRSPHRGTTPEASFILE